MRYAWRSLLRTPSFAAIAILTLAIGIGTNTAIFALVNELMFKQAQVVGSEDVHYVSLQIPDYETVVANRPEGVVAISAFEPYVGGLLQIPGRAAHVMGRRVAGGYADVQQV